MSDEGIPTIKPEPGGPRYYDYIAVVILCSFFICCSFLVFFNVNYVETYIEELFGPRKAFILQLYFWAALGATLISYKFLANDKERNEVESLKEHPDPIELRWPNSQNVVSYALRILMSGVMGVLGAAILLAGLGIFDATPQKWGGKEKAFFIVFCFVVGMHQKDFLAFVSGIKDQFFKSTDKGTEKPTPVDGTSGKRNSAPETITEIREKLLGLLKKPEFNAKALEWIAKEYPLGQRGEAYKLFDYSQNSEEFIINPPDEDPKKPLSKLLEHLSGLDSKKLHN